MKGEGLKEFAIRHPFITWFCFGKLCDSVVHIVRGYPTTTTTTTTYRDPDEKGEEVELDEEEVTIEPEEPETVNDETEEEA